MKEPRRTRAVNGRRLLGGRAVLRWVWPVGVAALIAFALWLIPTSSGTSLESLLPFMLVLACPLMMIFMMGSMNHMHGRHDLASSHAMDQSQLDLSRLTPEEQVRALRSELARMNWRQEALRQDVERLELKQRGRSGDTPAVRS